MPSVPYTNRFPSGIPKETMHPECYKFLPAQILWKNSIVFEEVADWMPFQSVGEGFASAISHTDNRK